MKKSKLALVGLVMASVVVLAGCSTKTDTTTKNLEVQETQNQDKNGQTGTPGQGGPQMKEIDYATASEKLGVTEDALKEAMGATEKTTTTASGTPAQPKRMDLATVAKTLGVEETALREALGMKDIGNGLQGDGQPPEGTPNEEVLTNN